MSGINSRKIEFHTDKDGQLCVINTPHNMHNFVHLSCSVQDVQRLMDSFLSDCVRTRYEIIKGDKVVAEQLARRVEIATKGLDGLIRAAVEDQVRAAVAQQVAKIVGGMKIGVSVSVVAAAETQNTHT
jgi:hypothetical protein